MSDKVNALSLNFYESFFYKYTYKIGDNFTRFGNSINTINFGNLKKQETIFSSQEDTNIKSNRSNLRTADTLTKIVNLIPNSNQTEEEKNNKAAEEYYNSLSEKQKADILSQTGKEVSLSSYTQQSNNYVTPNQLQQYYSQNPSVANYSANPSTYPNPTYNSNGQFVDQNGQVQTNTPITMNQSSFDGPKGPVSGLDSRIFKVLGDGWLQTNSSIFGLNVNGSPDTVINPAYGGKAAMSVVSASGPIDVRNKHTCIVSMAREAQSYFFGQVAWQKGGAGTSIIEHYKRNAGTPVEIVNLATNRCVVAPLWEVGPGHGEGLKHGFGVDLTYCTYVTMLNLDKVRGAKAVKFRPVPKGKEGCEGYSDKQIAPVKILKKA